ncbi:MAG: C-terminal binding protein [Spirochaetales bacterium]|nr:C-terminal binding protein [Spirochaetales bacterium]
MNKDIVLLMEKKLVAILDNTFDDYKIEAEVLAPAGIKIEALNIEDPGQHKKLEQEALGIIVNLVPLKADTINTLQECRVISRYGVGYDNVDINAATQKGIWVANVPDYCIHEIAEHTLALLMGARRQIHVADSGVRKGRWQLPTDFIQRLNGQTLGICGFGRAGQAFFKMVRTLGWSEILIYDPFKQHEITEQGGQYVSKEELLQRADVITLHIPLSENTFHYLDKAAIDNLKPHALVINTSRGKVIDQEALYQFLINNPNARAAVDVMETEPPEVSEKLFTLNNFLATPHMAYYSCESVIELKKKAALNVLDVLQNRPPKYPVNSLK